LEKKETPMGTNHKSDICQGKITSELTFEQKVWAITARIPRGKVATYAWVAHQLDSKAYRAVGRALGRNPFAPAVPCHRLVGSNGALTGFAWGLPKKRQLLNGEGIDLINDRVPLGQFAV
jgi:methylated-DNA-[protein]-cysteine S-methyltransferase